MKRICNWYSHSNNKLGIYSPPNNGSDDDSSESISVGSEPEPDSTETHTVKGRKARIGLVEFTEKERRRGREERMKLRVYRNREIGD